MRTALMEMAHGKKPKTERAAWVPESILDDDVSHFMGAAAAAKKAGKSHFDFGGKKYKVTMKHDTAKKVDESAECPTCRDGECQCEQPVEENYTDKQDASYRDEPTPKGAQKRLKALHKKALAYRKKHGKFPSDPYSAAKKSKVDLKFESVEEKMDPKDHVKYNDEMEMYCVYNKSGKVVAKFKDQKQANDYAMKNHDDLMEALAPGATAQHSATKETSDTWDKQMSNGENDIPMGKKKDFVDQHNMEVAYDAEAIYKQNKYEALSKTPARPGDKSDGDKNVVNPIPTNMVDGMRAALAKMKNSGE